MKLKRVPALVLKQFDNERYELDSNNATHFMNNFFISIANSIKNCKKRHMTDAIQSIIGHNGVNCMIHFSKNVSENKLF